MEIVVCTRANLVCWSHYCFLQYVCMCEYRMWLLAITGADPGGGGGGMGV